MSLRTAGKTTSPLFPLSPNPAPELEELDRELELDPGLELLAADPFADTADSPLPAASIASPGFVMELRSIVCGLAAPVSKAKTR